MKILKDLKKNEFRLEMKMIVKLIRRAFRRRKLLKNQFHNVDNDILDVAKQNRFLNAMHPNPPGLPLSNRWLHYISKIQQDIEQLKTVEEAVYYAQSQCGFDHRQQAILCLQSLGFYEFLLINEFPHFEKEIVQMSDSPFSMKSSLEKINGRWVSNVFYFHLRYLLQCLTHVKNLRIVCEIGGGYGGPARLWMTNPIHQLDNYIIIDFPECLFFAEIFLKTHGIKIARCEDFVQNPSNFKNFAILCPIAECDMLSNIEMDLVVNTGSMQEMMDEWIDYWMSWLDRMPIHYFYSLNYFAQPLSNLDESANTYSPRLSQKWNLFLKRSNPYFVMNQSPRDFAEILAKKETQHLSKEAIAERYSYLKKQALDKQNFLECMDLFRLSQDSSLIVDLVSRYGTAATHCPKELYYLTNIIRHQGLGKENQSLQNFLNKIHLEYQNSIKDSFV